jgi:hypothetical protein
MCDETEGGCDSDAADRSAARLIGDHGATAGEKRART